MSDRKEYLKKYRLEHKEKYREYQRKYRGTHLSTYEKLQQENQKYKEVIDKSIEYIENFLCTEEYINVNGIAIADNYKSILKILKGGSK